MAPCGELKSGGGGTPSTKDALEIMLLNGGIGRFMNAGGNALGGGGGAYCCCCCCCCCGDVGCIERGAPENCGGCGGDHVVEMALPGTDDMNEGIGGGPSALVGAGYPVNGAEQENAQSSKHLHKRRSYAVLAPASLY